MLSSPWTSHLLPFQGVLSVLPAVCFSFMIPQMLNPYPPTPLPSCKSSPSGLSILDIVTYLSCPSSTITQHRAAFSDQLPTGLHYIGKFLVLHILLWMQASLAPCQEPLPGISPTPTIPFCGAACFITINTHPRHYHHSNHNGDNDVNNETSSCLSTNSVSNTVLRAFSYSLIYPSQWPWEAGTIMKKETEANRHQVSCLGLPSKWKSLDMSPGSCSQPTFFTTMQEPPEHHSPLIPGQRASSQGHGEEAGGADVGNVYGLFISI